jgi:flagellar biosynthesis protein FlhG
MPESHSDQADGLRRLFPQGGAQRFLGVAANAEVAFSGLALERLAAACAAPERRVLVVDCAAPTAQPKELAQVDLAACIEPISPRLSYLAARGLPLRHVDSRGSCENFLQAVGDAAPSASVVIVHAEAVELGRAFARRECRPILLAADHPGSVTSAYANMKMLAARHGLMAFDLLLVAAANSPRTPHIAEQLALTADRYAGTALHDWAAIDPVVTEPGPDLMRLALAQLAAGPTTAIARALSAPLAGYAS